MTVTRRFFLGAAAATAAVLTGCAGGYAPPDVPRPRVWERWQRHQAGSRRFVDHRSWAMLLDRHVFARSDQVHLFAYGDLTRAERGQLDSYIQNLATYPVDALDRREQYAYWLNLYNALAVRLVLSRYLVLSIRDIDFGGGPIGDGPFDRKLVAVLGEPVSLSDIRNRILRPIFNDPRLHYGLCDAAIGAPNLQRRVFTGDRVDRMLDGAALDYVNHPRGVRREGPRLVLSGLYDWYATDFGETPASVLSHVRRYASPGLVTHLGSALALHHEFDWSLNDGTGIRG